MAHRRRRVLLSTLPPLVAAVPGLVVLLRDWDRLPAEIASHFVLSGQADAVAGRGTTLGLHLGITIGLAVLFGVLAATWPAERTTRFDPGRLLVGGSWFAATLTGGVFLLSALAVTDPAALADPLAARLPIVRLPILLVVALVLGVLGGVLTPALPLRPGTQTPATPLPLGQGERASWTGTCSSLPMRLTSGGLLLAGVVLVALAVVLPVWGLLVPGAVLVLVGVLMLLFGSARTTVDARGLTVGLGVFGVPRIRVPLAEIASVSSTDVVALQFGGWGYRLVPGGVGVIVRSGPALVVTRRSGRQLTVTVDDAGTAAALLAGLRERAC